MSNWSASVLSTATSDTEPTIIVTFEGGRYIFNAGEGANRAFVQGKQSWKKTKGLFFTEISTKRTSGIAGLLMTFADATISDLSVVGPSGLSHFLASMRFYTSRDSIHVTTTEAPSTPVGSEEPIPIHNDNNVTIYGIPILPAPASSISAPMDIEPAEESSKRKREDSPELPSKRLAASFEGEAPVPAEAPCRSDPDEYRRLIISKMFTGQKPEEPKQPETSNHGKGKKKQKQEKPPKEKKGPEPKVFGLQQVEQARMRGTEPRPLYRRKDDRPPGWNDQLPRFNRERTELPDGTLATPTLAYVIVGPRVRGKFDVQKAEELGVVGRNRGRLTKGETVTFKVKVGDETIMRTVRPEDLIGESEPAGVVMILDIPTPAHIPALISSFQDNPFYARLLSQDPAVLKEYAIRTVFHMCGQGVLEDERYINFMNNFVPTTHHLISSRQHSPDPVTFTSVAYNQLRLNQLDSNIFKIPKHSLTAPKSLDTIPNIPSNAQIMVPNQLIKLRPFHPPINVSSEEIGDRFHPIVMGEAEIQISERAQELFAEAKKNVEELGKCDSLVVPRGADVQIIPLGTSSAVPTKYRNVSSTLIRIPGYGSVLLDAGEGTWGQLVRQFGHGNGPSAEPNSGEESVWDLLRDLKCIYVSHIHADHHMGLAKILAQRKKLDPPPSNPLYLVSIRNIHLYLREMQDIEDLGIDDPSGNGVISVMSEALFWKKPTEYQKFGRWGVIDNEPWMAFATSKQHAEDMCKALGLEELLTADVIHRTRCYGAVLKHKDGWSIVFSGDTMPANSLVYAGQDATVLIHEATMDNDQVEMAAAKAHSTVGQALDIGRRMNAENILLTHFSARYPKMPPSRLRPPERITDDKDGDKEPVVALAFDNACLKIGDLWKVNYYIQAVERIMDDTWEEEGGEEAEKENEMANIDMEVARD